MDYIVQHIFGLSPLLDDHRNEQTRMSEPCLQWLREVAKHAVDAGLEGHELATAALIEPSEESGVEPWAVARRGDEHSYTRAGRALKKAFTAAGGGNLITVGEYTVEKIERMEYEEGSRKDRAVVRYVVRRASR